MKVILYFFLIIYRFFVVECKIYNVTTQYLKSESDDIQFDIKLTDFIEIDSYNVTLKRNITASSDTMGTYQFLNATNGNIIEGKANICDTNFATLTGTSMYLFTRGLGLGPECPFEPGDYSVQARFQLPGGNFHEVFAQAEGIVALKFVFNSFVRATFHVGEDM